MWKWLLVGLKCVSLLVFVFISMLLLGNVSRVCM